MKATCSNCGATDEPLPVLFGYPTDEAFAAAERGEIELGGCMPQEYERVCRACRAPVGVHPRASASEGA